MQRRTLRAFEASMALDPTPPASASSALRDFTSLAPPLVTAAASQPRSHRAAALLDALRSGRKASAGLVAALFSAATGLAVYDLYLFFTLVLR